MSYRKHAVLCRKYMLRCLSKIMHKKRVIIHASRKEIIDNNVLHLVKSADGERRDDAHHN